MAEALDRRVQGRLPEVADALMQQKAQCDLLSWGEAAGFNELGSKPVKAPGVVAAAR